MMALLICSLDATMPTDGLPNDPAPTLTNTPPYPHLMARLTGTVILPPPFLRVVEMVVEMVCHYNAALIADSPLNDLYSCQKTSCPPSMAPWNGAVILSPPFSRVLETMGLSIFPLDVIIITDTVPMILSLSQQKNPLPSSNDW